MSVEISRDVRDVRKQMSEALRKVDSLIKIGDLNQALIEVGKASKIEKNNPYVRALQEQIYERVRGLHAHPAPHAAKEKDAPAAGHLGNGKVATPAITDTVKVPVVATPPVSPVTAPAVMAPAPAPSVVVAKSQSDELELERLRKNLEETKREHERIRHDAERKLEDERRKHAEEIRRQAEERQKHAEEARKQEEHRRDREKVRQEAELQILEDRRKHEDVDKNGDELDRPPAPDAFPRSAGHLLNPLNMRDRPM